MAIRPLERDRFAVTAQGLWDAFSFALLGAGIAAAAYAGWFIWGLA